MQGFGRKFHPFGLIFSLQRRAEIIQKDTVGAARTRTAALLRVKQRRQVHRLHREPSFPWPYINSGNLHSLKVEPILVPQFGISTQF
ncbi:MAG: hypothetical protein DMG57_39125 [Acidobacteria bacterium]|nr:MAG: hypothetical protein DMG57_39125 [Acidobacteriota bacterium]